MRSELPALLGMEGSGLSNLVECRSPSAVRRYIRVIYRRYIRMIYTCTVQLVYEDTYARTSTILLLHCLIQVFTL